VERTPSERQVLARTCDHRHAASATVREGWLVGVEARRELHVSPEQLDHPAAAAPEVQHPALGSQVASHQCLELLIARAPARPHGSVALAVGVLDVQRQRWFLSHGRHYDESPPPEAAGSPTLQDARYLIEITVGPRLPKSHGGGTPDATKVFGQANTFTVASAAPFLNGRLTG